MWVGEGKVAAEPVERGRGWRVGRAWASVPASWWVRVLVLIDSGTACSTRGLSAYPLVMGTLRLRSIVSDRAGFTDVGPAAGRVVRVSMLPECSMWDAGEPTKSVGGGGSRVRVGRPRPAHVTARTGPAEAPGPGRPKAVAVAMRSTLDLEGRVW